MDWFGPHPDKKIPLNRYNFESDDTYIYVPELNMWVNQNRIGYKRCDHGPVVDFLRQMQIPFDEWKRCAVSDDVQKIRLENKSADGFALQEISQARGRPTSKKSARPPTRSPSIQSHASFRLSTRQRKRLQRDQLQNEAENPT